MNLSLFAVTFDCGDALAVAQFWSSTLGRPVDPQGSTDFASIGIDDADKPCFTFVKVPEGKAAKNRVHLDLATTDLDAEVGRLVGMGASQIADLTEGGVHWNTLADIEGNEFDVIAEWR